MRKAVLLLTLAVGQAAGAGSVTGRVQVVDKAGKAAADLGDTVVWIDDVKARPRPARATITMQGKAFVPKVTVVPVGSTVDFPNQDPILHNVFSVSGEGFDLGLYKRPKSGSRTFDKPGVYTLYCNIHPQMSATVVVRDNPYFAAASKDGSFRIAGVPAGEYKLVAYHDRAGESVPVGVKVSASAETAVNLSLDASTYKRVAHKNKFGKDYGKEAY